MNNDKELLILAAKAAGIELTYIPNRHGEFAVFRNQHGGETDWNPLISDSDALRLAVKLGIEIVFTENTVWLGKQHQLGDYIVDLYEPLNDDPYAATRRAIVRAAAEIGRGME